MSSLIKPSHGAFYAIRLEPGVEVMQSLHDFVDRHALRAVTIVGVVGSLTEAVIRYAGVPEGTVLKGKFEIISMIGTAEVGGSHIHLTISDDKGAVIGGHMLEGAYVRTTVELVLLHLEDYVFSRVPCAKSGWNELSVTEV